MSEIKDLIIILFRDVLETSGGALLDELTDDAILLDTGMNSLGFAILVARLEQDLGYDPFVLMDTPFYPTTFREFVDIYERFKDHRKL